MSKRLHIERIRDNGTLTMGRVSVWQGEIRVFQCVSLEPSWVLNQPYISCVPIGEYRLVKRTSDRFGTHFHIQDVPDRTFCLIHTLNYFKQSEGCVGVGKRFKYLNSDNEIDITNSADTLEELLGVMPDKAVIEISNHKQFQRFYQ